MRKKNYLLPAKKQIDTFKRNPAIETSRRLIKKRRHLFRLYFTAIVLLGMMLTLYVWQSNKMVEIKFRIKKVEDNIQNVKTSNSVLKNRISSEQSIARIEEKAKDELGMIPPINQPIRITLPKEVLNYE